MIIKFFFLPQAFANTLDLMVVGMTATIGLVPIMDASTSGMDITGKNILHLMMFLV